ncbi:MAG: hypothetical protein LE169_02970 [Endomicrobium sp.]|nr:hypothetical protein [Endomicrobium sp.]
MLSARKVIQVLEPSKSPAPEPTFTPNPTPELKGTVPDLSDIVEPSSWYSCFPAVNAGNRIANWILNIGIYVTVIVYIGYNAHGCVRLEPEIVHCPFDGFVNLPPEEISEKGYKHCYSNWEDRALLPLGIFLKR